MLSNLQCYLHFPKLLSKSCVDQHESIVLLPKMFHFFEFEYFRSYITVVILMTNVLLCRLEKPDCSYFEILLTNHFNMVLTLVLFLLHLKGIYILPLIFIVVFSKWIIIWLQCQILCVKKFLCLTEAFFAFQNLSNRIWFNIKVLKFIF